VTRLIAVPLLGLALGLWGLTAHAAGGILEDVRRGDWGWFVMGSGLVLFAGSMAVVVTAAAVCFAAGVLP
jgi:hypothetical protein